MKKRIVAVLFAVVMLVSSAFAASGEDQRASKYLDSYLIQIIPNGGTSMTATYGVYGTGKMTKIGADKLVIEERLMTGEWIAIETYFGSDDPDTFYSSNAYSNSGSIRFNGLPGVSYRATLTAYAANSSGSDTGTLTSAAKVCR